MTVSKAAVELRDIRAIAKELVPETLAEDQTEMWSSVGQILYGDASLRVLDEASRAPVVRLHNAGSPDLQSADADLSVMIARLEQTIVADSALNQLRVRPQISREIVRRGGRIEFATLNARIYDQVSERRERIHGWVSCRGTCSQGCPVTVS